MQPLSCDRIKFCNGIRDNSTPARTENTSNVQMIIRSWRFWRQAWTKVSHDQDLSDCLVSFRSSAPQAFKIFLPFSKTEIHSLYLEMYFFIMCNKLHLLARESCVLPKNLKDLNSSCIFYIFCGYYVKLETNVKQDFYLRVLATETMLNKNRCVMNNCCKIILWCNPSFRGMKANLFFF